jgi:hypothetical protein
MLAALTIISALAAEPPAYETTYDRFKDVSAIFSSNRLGADKYFVIQAVHKGKVPTDLDARAYRLQFWSTSRDGWEYLRCHDFSMLADGKPVRLGESEHDGSILSSGRLVSEYVTVGAGPEILEALANAEVVEIQVCSSVFTLPTRVRYHARDILAATTPPAPPTTPPAPTTPAPTTPAPTTPAPTKEGK